MKIIFMGTPEFSVKSLEKVVEENHNIELVVTQQDKRRGRGKQIHFTPVKEFALNHNIEVFQPENINSEESIALIENINPDLIIVVAYGQILSEKILNMPKYGCINVHASILPKYRGPAPINWAIISGEKISGITIMKMEKGLDTGDILHIEEVEISEEMTSGELHDRLMEKGGEALKEVVKNIEKYLKNRRKQNDDDASYAPKIDKSLGHIKWEDSKSIKNLVRGTQPWPGSFFYYHDKMIKVRNAIIEKIDSKGTLGEIVKIDDRGIHVNCKDGEVIFPEIQVPGKRWMTVSEYSKGNNIELGVILM